MFRSLISTVKRLTVIAALTSVGVVAMPVVAEAQSGVQFQRVYGAVAAPAGHTDFCRRRPSLCIGTSGQGAVALDHRALNDLVEVNNAVNGAIRAESDQALFGVVEHWDVAQQAGDCEDYALLKQRLLIARGWPSGALLLTVVIDETGGGHAVLVVRTTKGDVVLDNRTNAIDLWNSVPYRFVKRQSHVDPRAWVALDPEFVRPVRMSIATLTDSWRMGSDR